MCYVENEPDYALQSSGFTTAYLHWIFKHLLTPLSKTVVEQIQNIYYLLSTRDYKW